MTFGLQLGDSISPIHLDQVVELGTMLTSDRSILQKAECSAHDKTQAEKEGGRG